VVSSILICFLAVIKARILSAHDKGTHAEVVVKVKKVLKSGKVKIARSNRSIYPESWTNRGCTCPILNPGKDKMHTKYFPFPVSRGDNSLWTLACFHITGSWWSLGPCPGIKSH